jgi:hypothetical protein
MEEGEGGAESSASQGHPPPHRPLRASPAVAAPSGWGHRQGRGGSDGGERRDRVRGGPPARAPWPPRHGRLPRRRAGQDAAERIRAEAPTEPGVSVEWRQLDVADAASVEAFAAWVAETHGGVHALVRL